MTRPIDADRFEMSISEHKYKYFSRKDVIEAIKNELTIDKETAIRMLYERAISQDKLSSVYGFFASDYGERAGMGNGR